MWFRKSSSNVEKKYGMWLKMVKVWLKCGKMEQNEFKKIPNGFQTIRNEIQIIPSGGKYRFLP